MRQARGCASWYVLIGVTSVLCDAAAPGDPPDTIELSGTARDFRRSHPDFDVVPIGGPGHYAGNIGLNAGPGERPVFGGGGFKVADQWLNSSAQPIPPHLYASGGSAGVVLLVDAPGIHGNATFDTWDSSLGPYGGTNVGPPPVVQTGSTMPVIALPTNLGPSVGNLTLDDQTVSSDIHCDDLTISDTVIISGHRTVLCEGSFIMATLSDMVILPGSSLDLYVTDDVTFMPQTSLNARPTTGLPYLVTIYYTGTDEIRISQPHGIVYATVIAPNGHMEVMPNSGFFGNFIGKSLEIQPNAGFHVDTNAGGAATMCGVPFNDTAGSAAMAGDGAITSAGTFNEWYVNVLGVNLAAVHSITLILNASGVYEYLDGEFYPLDGLLYGNEGDPHNFYFTYEIEAEFTFDACGGQWIEFAGADDCWIFIGGVLGIDLGGILPGTAQVLELDRLALNDGQTYAMHLFFANRNPTASAFNLRTNVELSNEDASITASLPCD